MLRVARPTASLLRLKNADIHMLGVRASRKSTGCGQEHSWGRNHAPCDQPQAAGPTDRRSGVMLAAYSKLAETEKFTCTALPGAALALVREDLAISS